ncbi:MAG: hypothetical protein BroJett030_28820 [Alphaproteobacteria bacterium]|nr:MAG: hypothetical protein BroJett030_28820 [Alphaproteobacteria bacterium]
MLRDRPDPNADSPHGRVMPGDQATVIAEQADWSHVDVLTRDNVRKDGWVRTKWLVAMGQDEVPAEIDLDLFAQTCVDAARLVGVNSLYLIALAEVESGIRNVGTSIGSGTAFGPFQITQSTWNGYRQKPELGIDWGEQDRFDPMAQCDVAALIAAEAAVALATIPGVGPQPNAIQLYFAHLLGLPAARAALSAAPGTSILAVLTEVYAGKPDPAGFAGQIIANNPGLLSTGGNPNTVQQCSDAIDERFRPAFAKAYKLRSVLPDFQNDDPEQSENTGAGQVVQLPEPPSLMGQTGIVISNTGNYEADFATFIGSLNLRNFMAREFLALGSKHSNPNSSAFGLNTFPPRSSWINIAPTARVLDALRQHYGAPIYISSAYRSPAYNGAIGGATNSLHMAFKAIDFTVASGSAGPRQWADTLRQFRSQGLFAGGIGTYGSFVHVDTRGHNVDW